MENSDARKEIRRLLWRWGKVTATCARKQKELQEYLDLINSATDVKSSPLTGMPGGGGLSDPTARAAERLAYLKDRYQEMVDILTAEIDDEIQFSRAMDEAMLVLTVQERRIVELRYRNGWSFARIARVTSYSERQVQRHDENAVKAMGKSITVQKMS